MQDHCLAHFIVDIRALWYLSKVLNLGLLHSLMFLLYLNFWHFVSLIWILVKIYTDLSVNFISLLEVLQFFENPRNKPSFFLALQMLNTTLYIGWSLSSLDWSSYFFIYLFQYHFLFLFIWIIMQQFILLRTLCSVNKQSMLSLAIILLVRSFLMVLFLHYLFGLLCNWMISSRSPFPR